MPPTPDTLHLLIAADRTFGPWAGVMLRSVLRFDHSHPLAIHVLSDGTAPRDLARLGGVAAAVGAELNIYDVLPLLSSHAASLRVSHRIPRAAYARILFDQVIDPGVTRLLYLDGDMLCRGSLDALWRTDLGDCAIAGVADMVVGAEESLPGTNQRLGRPAAQPYVNSGMLLIDAAAWRREGTGARIIDYAKSHPDNLILHDQDAINVVLGGRIKLLDQSWNFLPKSGVTPTGREQIVHYCGHAKPWYTDFQLPFLDEWLSVKADSPWRSVRRIPYRWHRFKVSMRRRRDQLLDALSR